VSKICFQTLERKQFEGSKKQVPRRIFGLDRRQNNRRKKKTRNTPLVFRIMKKRFMRGRNLWQAWWKWKVQIKFVSICREDRGHLRVVEITGKIIWNVMCKDRKWRFRFRLYEYSCRSKWPVLMNILMYIWFHKSTEFYQLMDCHLFKTDTVTYV
jgi:hypothetical protein